MITMLPNQAEPSLTKSVKQVVGMLWYNLLSEMSKNTAGADALGTGSDSFQSMFLWNIAQNDFSKYDQSIASAAIKQLGNHASLASVATSTVVPVNLSGVAAVTPVTATPAIAPTTGDVLFDRATNFARSIWPEVQAAAAKLGVPAAGVLAQTALETGWGAATAGNNLFGVKSADGQVGTVRPTQEMVDGVLTASNSSFRDYDSTGASIADYVGQISTSFSGVIGQSSIAGFAQALQAGGYATDNRYASKIIGISQSPLMSRVLQAIR